MKRPCLFVILLTILVLILFEFFAQCSLKSSSLHYPLFYNQNSMTIPFLWEGKHKAYNNIDPLLGWGIHSAQITKHNYSTSNNCIVLETDPYNSSKLSIYISGGSTSDLMYDHENWPKYLLSILKQNNISAKLYVAAVGGYNSGQELLKTIRDIDLIKPDIHISYSGANETEFPSYTSPYEKTFFESSLKKKRTFLPNTIEVLTQMLGTSNNRIELSGVKLWKPHQFWEKNMSIMHQLSLLNNTSFVSILQPVKGQNSNLQAFEKYDEKTFHLVEDNKKFYPFAITLAKTQPYIHDFTQVFNDEATDVFSDDCHIAQIKHQEMIANAVFGLIESIAIKKLSNNQE